MWLRDSGAVGAEPQSHRKYLWGFIPRLSDPPRNWIALLFHTDENHWNSGLLKLDLRAKGGFLTIHTCRTHSLGTVVDLAVFYSHFSSLSARVPSTLHCYRHVLFYDPDGQSLKRDVKFLFSAVSLNEWEYSQVVHSKFVVKFHASCRGHLVVSSWTQGKSA